MKGNPFRSLKSVPTAKELLDIAFSRASKVTLPKSKDPVNVRVCKREIAKLKIIRDVIASRLDIIVKQFPNFEEIHPFYRALADTIVSIDELRQALASLTTAARIIKRIIRDSLRQLSRAKTPDEARRVRSAAYGRISSVIRRVKPRLDMARRAAREYCRLPSVNPDIPVLVAAGFPNVGKSSFVSLISSAQPEIAEYPFTTKGISVGHFPLEPEGGQILDLPGLLDRPMSERNPIERRAIAAIQYIADCILFLIDPTLTCGYELKSQVGLFHEIVNLFPSVDVYPVLNKCDIATKEEEERAIEMLGMDSLPRISTLTGEGVSEFLQEVLNSSSRVREKLQALLARLHSQ